MTAVPPFKNMAMPALELDLTFAIPLVLLLYWATLRYVRLNNLVLLFGGFLLYSWGHAVWGSLLFFLTILDYLLVYKFFGNSRYKRMALYLGLAVNVLAWLFCRYSTSLPGSLLYSTGFPMGMSFYLLRKLSYLLDNYRGKFNQPHDFLEYALYVSFYPQIFSGPVERPEAFISQIQKPRSLDWKAAGKALPLILMGLFKKMALADNLGMIVDRIFRLAYPSRLMLAAGSLGFAFEVYADFSGYTDLSRGFSCLLGFETSENFNQPYIAANPVDFWRRWHITLSNWLRDYVFYPLRRKLLERSGGKRGFADWAAPLAVMLISGLWHGSGWTCLAWGLFHGILLGFSQAAGWNRGRKESRLQKTLSQAATFVLVVFGWSIFRAPSLDWLARVWLTAEWGAAGSQGIALLAVLSLIALYILPLALFALVKGSGKARQLLEPAYYALALAALAIFAASGMQDFVYAAF